MMGWPAGWVTDLDISRNDQLRIISNGVVPQQAAAALQWLLSVCEVAASLAVTSRTPATAKASASTAAARPTLPAAHAATTAMPLTSETR